MAIDDFADWREGPVESCGEWCSSSCFLGFLCQEGLSGHGGRFLFLRGCSFLWVSSCMKFLFDFVYGDFCVLPV